MRERKIIALNNRRNEVYSAINDCIRRLVQSNAVIHHGGDLLRQGAGFDAAAEERRVGLRLGWFAL